MTGASSSLLPERAWCRVAAQRPPDGHRADDRSSGHPTPADVRRDVAAAADRAARGPALGTSCGRHTNPALGHDRFPRSPPRW